MYCGVLLLEGLTDVCRDDIADGFTVILTPILPSELFIEFDWLFNCGVWAGLYISRFVIDLCPIELIIPGLTVS